MAKKVVLTLNAPTISYIKLLVLQDLRLDSGVFYTAGHTIEVFYQEAKVLLEQYPDCFEVLE